jgi:hypothetical protein
MVQPFPISNAPRHRVSIALFSASRFAAAAIINQGASGKLVSPSGPITKSYATLFRLLRFFKRPNLDRRLSLVHRISYVWHHAANEILGDHRGSVTRRGLVLGHRRAFYQARIPFLRRAHRDGGRFIVKADDLLKAFLSPEKDAVAPKKANGNGTHQNVA